MDFLQRGFVKQGRRRLLNPVVTKSVFAPGVGVVVAALCGCDKKPRPNGFGKGRVQRFRCGDPGGTGK